MKIFITIPIDVFIVFSSNINFINMSVSNSIYLIVIAALLNIPFYTINSTCEIYFEVKIRIRLF